MTTFSVPQGADKVYRLTAVYDGATLDLTGAKIYASVKTLAEIQAGGTTHLIRKRNILAGGSNDEIEIAAPASNGQFDLKFVPADTAGLSLLTVYMIDVWLITAAGEHRQVVAAQRLEVAMAVTTDFSTTGSDTLWTMDGPGPYGVPVNSTEWLAVLETAGVDGPPISIYPCQDANTGLTDANGVHNLPVTATGVSAVRYQNTIPDWVRKGAGFVYAPTDNGFVKQHLNLPGPNTNSYLLWAYVSVTSDAGVDAGLLSLTDGAFCGGIKTGTRYPLIGAGGFFSSTGSTPLPIGTVFPIALKFDLLRGIGKFYTPWDILSRGVVPALAAEQEVDIGVALASGLFAANTSYPVGALFIGQGAEKTDEEIAAIWSTLGWSVAWYDAPVADHAKYFPLTKRQWQARGLIPPSFCWSMQETSGSVFTDYIGDQVLLTSNGYANYQKVTPNVPITGLDRHGVSVVDTFTAQAITNNSSAMPDTSTTSMALLVDCVVTGATTDPFPAFKNWVFSMGPGFAAHISTTGVWGINNPAGTGWNGTVPQFNTFGPVILVQDNANQKFCLYTVGEKITGTYAASVSGRGVFLGSASPSVPCPAATYGHAAVWKGADAERTDAQWRAVFAALGYTVTAW